MWVEESLPPPPEKTSFEDEAKPLSNNDVWDFSVSLMNRVAPFTTPPPLLNSIVKLFPESLSVCYEAPDAVALLQSGSWVSFTTRLGMYPESLRSAKQPNGHARLRNASADEIKRTTHGKHVGVLYVGTKAHADLLSRFPSPAVAVVLQVDDVRNPPMDLVRSIPLKSVGKTQLHASHDTTSYSACVVYWAGEGGAVVWPEKAVHAMLFRKDMKLRGVRDLYTYFRELRLVTRTQCLDHYKRSSTP